jgi:HEAT repeat protein
MTERKRLIALMVLGAFASGCAKEDPAYQVPGLEVMLKDSDPDKRATAAQVLGSYGSEAKASVPLLAAALKDESAAVRISVTYALADIGPDAIAAEEALLESLSKDSDAKVRIGAVYALSTIKPNSTAVQAALRKAAAKDPDQVVRTDAAQSLQRIRASAAKTQKKTPGRR